MSALDSPSPTTKLTTYSAFSTTNPSAFPRASRNPFAFSYIVLMFAILALISLAVAIGGPYWINHVVEDGINNVRILTSADSKGFESWANNTDNPLLLTVYMNHIMNPDEVLQGALIEMQEIGPFVYEDIRVKYDIEWLDDSKYIFYREWQHFKFRPDLSVMDDSYKITSINMGQQAWYAVSLNTTTNTSNVFVPNLFYFWMINHDQPGSRNDSGVLFITRSVREYLFGYNDDFLPPTNSFPGIFANRTFEQEQLVGLTDIIITGKDQLDQIHSYVSWHNQTELLRCPPQTDADTIIPCSYPSLPYVWGTEDANAVRGSDGTSFPTVAELTPSSRPKFFYYPLLRSIDLLYETSVEWKEVDVLRFSFPPELYENASEYLNNTAYYQFGPSGYLNMSSGSYNVPTFVSLPRHTTNASNHAQVAVIDDISIPTTLIDIEPQTGLTFHIQVASQLNIYIQPWNVSFNVSGVAEEGYMFFPNLTSQYVPLFWAVENETISDQDADSFRSQMNEARTDKIVIQGIGYVFCGIFLITGGVISYRKRRQSNQAIVEENRRLIGDPVSPIRFRARSSSSEQSFTTVYGANGDFI